jgi:hypothetical protein
LNTSKINDDNTILFDLLGKEVEISEWEDSKITFTQGKEYSLSRGESVVFDGKNITLEFVLDGAAYVSVDGDSQKIVEDTGIMKVEGIEIKAKEVLYSGYAGGYEKATLIIGTDIESTISDGEEYEEDSIWEWAINNHSIGLVLIEKFMELEEDFNALAQEGTICLPNDYVCIRYNGLIEEDTEKYTFELYDRKDKDYIKANGNFLSGINDYDRVYINKSGIYDRDFEEISTTHIEIGDTKLTLNISSESFIIKDFEITFDLNDVLANDLNVSAKDENYLTKYGILIENPEDSIKNEEFTITVPEEQSEGSITVKMGGFEEIEEDTTENDTTNSSIEE